MGWKGDLGEVFDGLEMGLVGCWLGGLYSHFIWWLFGWLVEGSMLCVHISLENL